MTVADDVRVLHRDAHLLALYKPSGLATTAPHGGACLVDVARRIDPDAPRVHPTSRLDAETTGVVLFARTRRATRALLAARRAGAYRRAYVALLGDAPAPPTGVWDWSIERDARDPRRRRAGPRGTPADLRRGKPASTAYAVAARTDLICVLHAWPRTGRTHQIRVHAAAAGCPLLGDVYYGGPRRRTLPDGSVATARRVMLHCALVVVPHPLHGRPVAIRAEMPGDLCALWSSLGGTNAPPMADV